MESFVHLGKSNNKQYTYITKMSIYSYSVGELKKVITESSNEFKPVLGKNVENDNKKNNDKSYKESEKRAKDYDGGLIEPKKGKIPPKTDQNRTTLDYNPMNEPDKEYKDKVKAQIKGYTSVGEMKNKINKAATFDDDRLLKYFEDARDKHDEDKVKSQKSGLVSRELPDDTFKKNKLSEGLKPKKLRFKNTTFVNESQMLNLIPEEYKKPNQRIHMVDKNNNEYIVECELCEMSGNVITNIKGYNNKTVLKEQSDRIYELMGYSSKDYYKKGTLNESKHFNDMFNTIRN